MAKTKIEMSEDELKKFEEIKKSLEKDFGKGTIIGASEKSKSHDVISTGSLGLDKALGVGGLAKGRIVEIYGPESSGKTTLAIHVIAEAQKQKGLCAFIDVEHAFDTAYAEKVGVDLDRLKISQPDYAEQALEVAERLAKSGLFSVIVVDSVAGLVPKAEVEREMGESSMGKQAQLMSQAMRKLTPIVSNSKCVMIFINQLREKIGVMFGSPETTTGGNALKFYASVRLDVRRSITKDNSVMDGETKLGNLTTVKVIKNKTAPPFRQCQFDILYGTGIDKLGEILDMAVEDEIVTKSGSYFSFEGEVIGQGRAKVLEKFAQDPELTAKIKEKIVDSYQPKEFVPNEVEN